MPTGTRPLGKPPGGPGAGSGKPPARKRDNDYKLAYIASIVVAILVVGFVLGWAYLKPMQGRIETDVAFAKAGPFHIEIEGYTYNATLAIKTDSSNARWARNHQDAINEVLYRALLSADPKVMSKPEGLQAMQETLTRTVNQGLDKPRVQQILFTDFVLQAD